MKDAIDEVWEKIYAIKVKHFKCPCCQTEFSKRTRKGFIRCINKDCKTDWAIPSIEWQELENYYLR